MSDILRSLALQKKLRQRLEETKDMVDIDGVPHYATHYTRDDWLAGISEVLDTVTDAQLLNNNWHWKHEEDIRDFDAEVIYATLVATTQTQKTQLRNVATTVWTTNGDRTIVVTIENDTWRQRLFCDGKAFTDEQAPLKEVLNALQ